MKDVKVYWQKKLGGANSDICQGICIDSSGNVYLSGSQQSDSYGTTDYGVIKLDSSGNIIWQKKIGGIDIDTGYGIGLDGSGNVYVSGSESLDNFGTTGSDYNIIKLDNNGNLIWNKKAGGYSITDTGRSIAVDISGNVYMVGYHSTNSYGGSDYGVIKIDTNGNLIWQKKIGGTSSDIGNGIDVDSSGNVYIVGYQSSDTSGYTDYGVIKLATDGNIIWQKKIGSILSEAGLDCRVDGSGNIHIIGYTNYSSFGDNDYNVIKLDSNGNLLWQKKIGGSGTDYGYGICVDSSGNVYVNGQQESDTYGTYDYGVVKLDSSGNLIWQKKIGGSLSEVGFGICADSSGHVYLNGYQASDTYGGAYDYGVFKLNSDQESDMNLSYDDSRLSISNMNLSIGDMTLSYGDAVLTVGDMNLSIGDIDISGEVGGGLVYLG